MKSMINSIAKTFLVALIVAGSVMAAEDLKLPATTAGKKLTDFIKAFNTGDLETLKKFHRDRGGEEENAQQDVEFFQQSGGLKLHSVKRSDEYEIEVLAQTIKGEQWVSFAMGVDSQAPHGINNIRVQPASAPDKN